MDFKMEVFLNRWETIENRTILAVRDQLKRSFFDITAVNKVFLDSCAEWFGGNSAPHMWFLELEKEDVEKARELKKYIADIRISEHTFSKPLLGVSFVVAIVVLLACFVLLHWMTEMGMAGKCFFSIGVAVVACFLYWLIAKQKQVGYEEKVVGFYRSQLEEFLNGIARIIS